MTLNSAVLLPIDIDCPFASAHPSGTMLPREVGDLADERGASAVPAPCRKYAAGADQGFDRKRGLEVVERLAAAGGQVRRGQCDGRRARHFAERVAAASTDDCLAFQIGQVVVAGAVPAVGGPENAEQGGVGTDLDLLAVGRQAAVRGEIAGKAIDESRSCRRSRPRRRR